MEILKRRVIKDRKGMEMRTLILEEEEKTKIFFNMHEPIVPTHFVFKPNVNWAWILNKTLQNFTRPNLISQF